VVVQEFSCSFRRRVIQFNYRLWSPPRILLVVYINDLPQSLLKSSIGMYPDDTVKYYSDSSADIIKHVLQNDLNSVEKWLASNKSQWMLFGARQKLEHCPDHRLQLHGKEIERVSSFCYLRVTLDENLSWNEHVELVCNKGSRRPAYDLSSSLRLLNACIIF